MEYLCVCWGENEQRGEIEIKIVIEMMETSISLENSFIDIKLFNCSLRQHFCQCFFHFQFVTQVSQVSILFTLETASNVKLVVGNSS